mgnify:CR=1 FL=1
MLGVGKIQIKQIEKILSRDYVPSIDDSDTYQLESDAKRKKMLSRALAAFYLNKRHGIPIPEACAAIVDGFQDQGIDAIAIDRGEKVKIILVQSKWSDEGKGSLNQETLLKLREGFTLLTSEKFDRFNQKVQSRRREISDVLNEFDVKITLAVVTMSKNQASGEYYDELQEWIREEYNDGKDPQDPSGTVFLDYRNQSDLYVLLTDSTEEDPIDLEVEIRDWGKIDEPYKAIYGHVSGGAVAGWVEKFGDLLTKANVRSALGETGPNNAIQTTVREEPSHFWYYNNGVTILCDSFQRILAQSTDRKIGLYKFHNVKLVNGAQTANTLRLALKQTTDASLTEAPISLGGSDAEMGRDEPANDPTDVRVMARFISLDGAPDDFDTRVTRATNTQNAIGGRDFASMDELQGQLKKALALEGFKYVVKRGEVIGHDEEGCDLSDAAIALATIHSPELATQAKREAGRLWEDIKRPPYTAIFDRSWTTHVRLRRAFELVNAVENELDDIKPGLDDRTETYVVHGNRLIGYLLFRKCGLESFMTDDDLSRQAEWENALKASLTQLPEIASSLKEAGESMYGGYTRPLMLNKKKTAEIATRLLGDWEVEARPD